MTSISTNHRKKHNSIYFYDYQPKQASFIDEVIQGMQQTPRKLEPKFFYDERGSQLFDAICDTEEYYPTKTEMAILKQNIDEIAGYIGEKCLLIEPGSGSSQKVRIMLDEVNPRAYMPLDISKDYLCYAANNIAEEFPWLEVHAACVDYTSPFLLPCCHEDARKVAFFPGSSIGNFDPEQAVTFLKNIALLIDTSGGLLIGVDLKKETKILNAAYNDEAGITAEFNKNLLTRIRNELDADIDNTKFKHHAFYNEKMGRIEMHLVCKEDHTLSIDGHEFEFLKDESIHTESSYKYTIPEFQHLARKAGFIAQKVWTDSKGLFSVHYFEVA